MADVRFRNSRSAVISVAYMRLDHACGADCGDPWDVLGWVNLLPRRSRHVPILQGTDFSTITRCRWTDWCGPVISARK